MKKTLWTGLAMLGLSFVLSGLQGSLYFFPIPLPSFWFVILTYYSFKKPLRFSLALNVLHLFVIAAFASTTWASLLLLMNLFTLSFYLTGERFHTSQTHVALGAGAGYVIFQGIQWLVNMTWTQWAWPPLLSWMGTGSTTLLVAPILIYTLESISQRIEYERVDTLENLRI